MKKLSTEVEKKEIVKKYTGKGGPYDRVKVSTVKPGFLKESLKKTLKKLTPKPWNQMTADERAMEDPVRYRKQLRETSTANLMNRQTPVQNKETLNALWRDRVTPKKEKDITNG